MQDKPRKVMINIRLTEEEKRLIAQAAKRERRTMTQYLIKAGLDAGQK